MVLANESYVSDIAPHEELLRDVLFDLVSVPNLTQSSFTCGAPMFPEEIENVGAGGDGDDGAGRILSAPVVFDCSGSDIRPILARRASAMAVTFRSWALSPN